MEQKIRFKYINKELKIGMVDYRQVYLVPFSSNFIDPVRVKPLFDIKLS